MILPILNPAVHSQSLYRGVQTLQKVHDLVVLVVLVNAVKTD